MTLEISDGLGFLSRLRQSPVGRAYRRLPVDFRLRMGQLRRRVLPRPNQRPTLDPALRQELNEVLGEELEGALRMASSSDAAPAGADGQASATS